MQTAEAGAEKDVKIHTSDIGTCGNSEAELIERVLRGCQQAFCGSDAAAPQSSAIFRSRGCTKRV